MEPIKPRKLADSVQDRLLEIIQEGRPGELLPSEREMMEQLGVGRPAIREALQRLEQMGLIEIRHGGRARISQPSVARMVDQMDVTVRHLLNHAPASIEHLREARAMFETALTRVAAARRSKSDVERLRKIVDTQEAAIGDADSFVTADGQFHRELAAISGNPILTAVSEALFQWLQQFRTDLVRLPGHEAKTCEEHRAVVEAIAAGDQQRAAKAIEDHLYRAQTSR